MSFEDELEKLLEEPEEEEEYLVRPTGELARFIAIFDKAISELSRLQLSGVFYLSPRPQYYVKKTIEILEAWRFFSKFYAKLYEAKRKEFYKKIYEETRAVTGLEPVYQIKIVIETFAFIQGLYRTSYSTLQLLWTGLYWFMTQGKVELRYMLQPYLGAKGLQIVPTFGGEEKEKKR